MSRTTLGTLRHVTVDRVHTVVLRVGPWSPGQYLEVQAHWRTPLGRGLREAERVSLEAALQREARRLATDVGGERWWRVVVLP